MKNLPQKLIIVLGFILILILWISLKNASTTDKFVLTVILILLIAVTVALSWKSSKEDNHETQATHNTRRTKSWTVTQTAKPKNNVLTLSSVRKPGDQQEPAGTLIPISEQTLVPNQPKPIELSDVEKELNYAKSISDIINELTIQIKRTEKNKTDSITKLKQSEEGLKNDLKSREDQLDALREKLHSQPALRALINVKKTFGDISRTKKALTTEEVIKFVVDTIDQKLIDLDIQKIEFPEGTKLSDIPFDQIDTSGPTIATENESQNNTVANLISPCYFIISDSKKIIINKAIVSLYRFTPPSPQPQISQI
jgi:Ca2+/Na+ antiporter